MQVKEVRGVRKDLWVDLGIRPFYLVKTSERMLKIESKYMRSILALYQINTLVKTAHF